jgi:6-pyruvoyltetrahydropterin/6-carboxytetrahydropterin synthase
MNVVCLTRRATFCASHRLYSKKLTAAQNKKIFDKCAHKHGHGHNYVLEVTVRGPVSARHGMVMNLTDLKRIIEQHVLKKVDHKHINLDVREFKTLIPTAENMAVVFWRWLEPHCPGLFKIKLYETENNIVEYGGT